MLDTSSSGDADVGGESAGPAGRSTGLPGSYKIEVGLACQTMVQPNMYLAQIPFFPATKAIYDIEKVKPDHRDPGEGLSGIASLFTV